MKRSKRSLNVHIGGRIRQERKSLGLSQDDLGKKMGVTFQQVQKYEKGTNSLNATRLLYLSKVFNLSVDDFFDGYKEATK